MECKRFLKMLEREFFRCRFSHTSHPPSISHPPYKREDLLEYVPVRCAVRTVSHIPYSYGPRGSTGSISGLKLIKREWCRHNLFHMADVVGNRGEEGEILQRQISPRAHAVSTQDSTMRGRKSDVDVRMADFLGAPAATGPRTVGETHQVSPSHASKILAPSR